MIKNKEYYNDLHNKFKKDFEYIDYYLKQCIKCKNIYISTLHKRGIYKIINKLAERLNQRYYRLAMDLATENMNISLREIKELETFIKEQA